MDSHSVCLYFGMLVIIVVSCLVNEQLYLLMCNCEYSES